MELFTPGHELYPTDLVEGEATPAETLPEDGEMPPLHTQPLSQSSPPVDVLYSPPQRLCEDSSDAAHLASESDTPRDCLTAANDKVFEVYQDWMHQNFDTHLDVGIEENGRWQQR